MSEKNTILERVKLDAPNVIDKQQTVTYVPIADEGLPGIVKPDGEQFIVDADGTLHVQPEYITRIEDITDHKITEGGMITDELNRDENGNTIVTVILSNGEHKEFTVSKGDKGLPYIICKRPINNSLEVSDGMVILKFSDLSRNPEEGDVIFAILEQDSRAWVALLSVEMTDYASADLEAICDIITIVETTGPKGTKWFTLNDDWSLADDTYPAYVRQLATPVEFPIRVNDLLFDKHGNVAVITSISNDILYYKYKLNIKGNRGSSIFVSTVDIDTNTTNHPANTILPSFSGGTPKSGDIVISLTNGGIAKINTYSSTGNWSHLTTHVGSLMGPGVDAFVFDKKVYDGYQYIVRLTNGKTTTIVAPIGPEGKQGQRGEPFGITKIYPSISAMEDDFNNTDVKEGQFVIIDTGDVNDPDNAKLYVKGSASWRFITDMSGAIGMAAPAPLSVNQSYVSSVPPTYDIYTFDKSMFNRTPMVGDAVWLHWIERTDLPDDGSGEYLFKDIVYLVFAICVPWSQSWEQDEDSFEFAIQNFIKLTPDSVYTTAIQLGMDGIIESNRVIFTVQDAQTYLPYRKNLQKFIVTAYLPVAGTLPDEFPVNITFGDTTYNLYNMLTGRDVITTIGDMMSVSTYSREGGYFFNTELLYLENADFHGFVILPVNITAKQIDQIVQDNDTIVTDLSSDGTKLSIHLHTDIVNKLQKVLVQPTSTGENTLVGIDSQGMQDVVKLGGTLKQVNDTLDVAEENLHGIRYDIPQNLSDEEKAKARSNIGAGESGFSGSYKDLSDKPKVVFRLESSEVYDEIPITEVVDFHKLAATGLLSDAVDDETHRTVTDVEKAKWNTVDDKIDKVDGTGTGTHTFEYIIASGIKLKNMIASANDVDYFVVSDTAGNMKKREIANVAADIGASSVLIDDVMVHKANFKKVDATDIIEPEFVEVTDSLNNESIAINFKFTKEIIINLTGTSGTLTDEQLTLVKSAGISGNYVAGSPCVYLKLNNNIYRYSSISGAYIYYTHLTVSGTIFRISITIAGKWTLHTASYVTFLPDKYYMTFDININQGQVKFNCYGYPEKISIQGPSNNTNSYVFEGVFSYYQAESGGLAQSTGTMLVFKKSNDSNYVEGLIFRSDGIKQVFPGSVIIENIYARKL